MPNYIPATGRTLHVVGVWVNRIGKEQTTEVGVVCLDLDQVSDGLAKPRADANAREKAAPRLIQVIVEVAGMRLFSNGTISSLSTYGQRHWRWARDDRPDGMRLASTRLVR